LYYKADQDKQIPNNAHTPRWLRQGKCCISEISDTWNSVILRWKSCKRINSVDFVACFESICEIHLGAVQILKADQSVNTDIQW